MLWPFFWIYLILGVKSFSQWLLAVWTASCHRLVTVDWAQTSPISVPPVRVCSKAFLYYSLLQIVGVILSSISEQHAQLASYLKLSYSTALSKSRGVLTACLHAVCHYVHCEAQPYAFCSILLNLSRGCGFYIHQNSSFYLHVYQQIINSANDPVQWAAILYMFMP